MKKLFLLLVIWAGIGFKASACMCHTVPFCHSLNQLQPDLVVSGVITSFDATDTLGLQLRVLDKFKGQETRDTITIWAGTGIWIADDGDCGGWQTMAVNHLGSVGDTIIIMLPRINAGNLQNPWEVAGDYRRPEWNCRYSSLAIENGIVKGTIYGNELWMGLPTLNAMPYPEFLAAWNNGEFECKTVIGKEDDIPVPSAQLFPNPALETITVQLPAGTTYSAPYSLVLTDITGRKVLQRPITGTEQKVWVGDLPRGLYLVSVTTANGENWQQKLVIEK